MSSSTRRPPAKTPVVEAGGLSVASGTALYVGSLIGPGVLLVPALAVRTAGPASVISWGALLVLSAPLAVMFAALGVRMPVAGGVAEYVRVAFGQTAGVITGGWFLTAVLLGAPTVAMIGGFYVASLTHSDATVAACVGLAIFMSVLGANCLGLRVSSKVQIAVAAVVTVLVALAVGTALPVSRARNWTPFAPHGWWAVGTAGNILVWLFVGWESVAQLTGEFRDPRTQLPRAMSFAFATIVVLYSGLAIATVGVDAGRHSSVPLAALMAAGLGGVGRRATTILAVALAMATMNVYLASAARLASALSRSGAACRRRAALAAATPAGGHRRRRCLPAGGARGRTHYHDGAGPCDLGVLRCRLRRRDRLSRQDPAWTGSPRDGADSRPGHGNRALLIVVSHRSCGVSSLLCGN